MNEQRKRTAAASQPAASENIASVLRAVSLQPEPANEATDRLPEFFEALRRQRHDIDHCGTNWRGGLTDRQSCRLAGAHRKTSGISALASLLMADFEVQQDGDEPAFSPHTREGLFLALTELTQDVHNTLSVIGQELARAGKGREA